MQNLSSKQEPNCPTKKWSIGHGKLTWIGKVSYVSNKTRIHNYVTNYGKVKLVVFGGTDKARVTNYETYN